MNVKNACFRVAGGLVVALAFVATSSRANPPSDVEVAPALKRPSAMQPALTTAQPTTASLQAQIDDLKKQLADVKAEVSRSYQGPDGDNCAAITTVGNMLSNPAYRNNYVVRLYTSCGGK
jgi:hypothetical protein